jgi:6-phosphofructokinase 1
MMPKNFIRADGYGITAACRNYLEPLIAGEAYPPYANGIPTYLRVPKKFVKRKLAEYSIADK